MPLAVYLAIFISAALGFVFGALGGWFARQDLHPCGFGCPTCRPRPRQPRARFTSPVGAPREIRGEYTQVHPLQRGWRTPDDAA